MVVKSAMGENPTPTPSASLPLAIPTSKLPRDTRPFPLTNR